MRQLQYCASVAGCTTSVVPEVQIACRSSIKMSAFSFVSNSSVHTDRARDH